MASLSDPFNGTLADLYSSMGVPYQLYDNPGIYNRDDAYVRPGMFGDQIPVFDGQSFKLMNGKNTLYEGTGIEALQEAARLSRGLGNGWRILGSAPEQDRDAGILNQLFAEDGSAGIGFGGRAKSDWDAKMLLPTLPFLATIAAPAIGGMLGGGGAAGAGATTGAAGAAGAAGGAATGTGVLGAGALGAALPAFEGITVIGGAAGGLGAGTAAGLAGAGALGGLAASNLGGASAGAQPGGFDPNAEIVVSAPASPPPVDVLGPLGPAINLTGAATGALNTGAGPVSEPTAQPQGTTDRIISALKGAGLLTGILGNAIGGGGGGDNGTIPGGAGSLNPIFTDKLPDANIPGLAARDMPAQDWTRYAMRPEQSFFDYVPQGYTPPPPDTLDPEWDKERNFAVGGMVKGRGTGRGDTIPANLSDGEYVIDAETVALLGDGSNDAGAKALDSFRANIRRHKGRDLAKGRFSVKAKSPGKYLKGRK